MKKFRITLRDIRQDEFNKLNPTAKNIIVEVEKEEDLDYIIVEKARELFDESSLEYVRFAYFEI